MVYKFWMHNSSSIVHSVIEFLSALSGFHAYVLILGVLFVCGMGVPIPEDITLITAGLLAGQGKVTFIGAVVVGFFGVLTGDTILFLIGRKFGRKVFAWPVFNKVFTESRIVTAELQIMTHAKKICFTARFMPGLRAPIFLTAGIMKVPFKTFVFQDGMAALLSVPTWVYLGYWFSDNIDAALKFAKELNAVIIATLVIAVIVFIYFQAKKKEVKAP
jgi:membrane protein DedA with SNARE-associated domain